MNHILLKLLGILLFLGATPAKSDCSIKELVQEYAPKPFCKRVLDGKALAHSFLYITNKKNIQLVVKRDAGSNIFGFSWDLRQGDPLTYSFRNKKKILITWKDDVDSLLKFVNLQEDFRITPLTLLTVAIQVAEGELLRAMKMIYNFMVFQQDHSNHYRQETKDRITFEHVVKLYDITGEEVLFNGVEHFGEIYVRGDKFNAWYHFFGIATTVLTLGKRMTSVFLAFENREDDNEYMDVQKMKLFHEQAIVFSTELLDLVKVMGKSSEPPKQIALKQYVINSEVLKKTDYPIEDEYCLQENQQVHEYRTDQATLLENPSFMQKVHVFRRIVGKTIETPSEENRDELRCGLRVLAALRNDTKNPEGFDFAHSILR